MLLVFFSPKMTVTLLLRKNSKILLAKKIVSLVGYYILAHQLTKSF